MLFEKTTCVFFNTSPFMHHSSTCSCVRMSHMKVEEAEQGDLLQMFCTSLISLFQCHFGARLLNKAV